jgi:predicted GH43/DUF377 family glycosyl hydrolase
MTLSRSYLNVAMAMLVLAACTPAPLPTSTQPRLTNIPPPATATFTPSPPPVTPTVAVQPATLIPTPVQFFSVYSDEPVVMNGDPGNWDDRYTDPGAVLFYGGMFHMFRNGFRDWPASVQIGYALSPDGYTWTKQGNEPVLRTENVPNAGVAALASSALVEDDGTWVLYFYTWQSMNYPSAGGIGRATAPSPTGPWTVDPELVLTPGGSDSWDSHHVLAPDVIKTDDGYRMYYSGYNRTGTQQIGMATSEDGIHWAKYDDPGTTNAAFAESDPVFTPKMNEGWVHQPRVRPLDAGWILFYRTEGGSDMALGYATSTNGIHWERPIVNPVLTAQAVKGGRSFWFTNVVYYEDTYFLYWEVEKSLSTEIYLATHKGGVP